MPNVTTFAPNNQNGHVSADNRSTWAACNDANPGDAVDLGAEIPAFQAAKISDTSWYIRRYASAHDLTIPATGSAIPAGANITAVTLQLWLRAPAGADATSAEIVAFSQVSYASLAVGDFNSAGATSFASRLLSDTPAGAGGYLTFTFNAAGRADLKAALGGKYYLAGRNSLELGGNGTPPTSNNYVYTQTVASANPPILTVTWTVPGGDGGATQRKQGALLRLP